jgi:surfeit locus 1 family protein
VLQTGEASEGLLRQWAEPSTGIDKHYGYAFQWFGLAGLIFILYVWFQIVRRFFFPPRTAR